MVETHRLDPAVIGIEPVNEPWGQIPLDELKGFYWQSYQVSPSV